MMGPKKNMKNVSRDEIWQIVSCEQVWRRAFTYPSDGTRSVIGQLMSLVVVLEDSNA